MVGERKTTCIIHQYVPTSSFSICIYTFCLFSCLLKFSPVSYSEIRCHHCLNSGPVGEVRKGLSLIGSFRSECYEAGLPWFLSVSYFCHSISHTICDICHGFVNLSAESWSSEATLPRHNAYSLESCHQGCGSVSQMAALLHVWGVKEKTVMSQPVFFS